MAVDIDQEELDAIAIQVADELDGEPMTEEEISAEIARMNQGE